DWSQKTRHGLVARALVPGAALGALTYSYAGGRLLAPMYAAALLVFVGRGSWRWVLATWGAYALALIPLVAYWFRHPGALTARYHETKFSVPGMSKWDIVARAASNYLHDVNLYRWLVSGDEKPYFHTWGVPQLGVAL